MTPTNLVLVVRRKLKASPERLFDAWTKPELMKQWFHAVENWTTPMAEVDLKPGGAWKVDMKREDGFIHHALGEYREIDRPNKLVFTWHPYGDTSVETVVTLRFKKVADNETELTLTHEGLRNEKEKSDHTAGWTGCLDSLATFTDSNGEKK
jgi:uncharacterized protein YndB with AHSA1/START domain